MSAYGALVACLVAACGSGDDGMTPLPTGDAQPLACNPVTQAGCLAGEKCTWIVDLDATPNANEIGHIGCTSAGALAAGDACDDGLAGMIDGCAAGTLCISGTCKPICDPQLVSGAAPGACPVNYSCSTYGGIFESAGDPVAGVCEPGCDPLTQKLEVGAKTAACGSVDPAQPTGTCVASEGYRSFHCAPTTPELYARTDRVAPLLTSDGTVYPNGCAPGFIPFYYEDASGAMTMLCTGLCAPLKVDSTIAMDAAHRADAKGDAKALGKLPADAAPKAGHATCAVGIKGSEDAEDCRFLWFPLAQGDPTRALTTPYNDSLGVCFAYEKYLTITIPGMAQKAPEKSCADLPVNAPDNDPYGAARDNGCYPLSQSMIQSASAPVVRRGARYRLANPAVPLARHVFE